MFSINWSLVGLAVITYLVYIYVKKRNYPPGPWGLPVLGSSLLFRTVSPEKKFFELSKKYGTIYSLTMGNVHIVVLTDAALVREIFRREECTARAPLYLTHGIMGGYGLICAEGALWKDQRRQVIDWLKRMGMVKFGAPRAILERKIRDGVEDFLETIRAESSNALEYNPQHALLHSMGNILNDLIFGLKYPKDDVTWKYLQNLAEEGVKHIGVSGAVNFLPFLRFLPKFRKIIDFLLEGKRITHKIYDGLIDDCRKRLEMETTSMTSEECDENDNEEAVCRSILERFLREKKKRLAANDPTVELYTDIQLRHLMADVFGAGVDTTLSTVRWTLLFMAKYPKYQDMLRKELSAFDRDELCLDDLDTLDILKACISEVGRIRPAVPIGVPHGTKKDIVVNGYDIPKNSMVICLLWGIHMNPIYFPEPEVFNPLRFINSEGKHFIPPQFIPFQTGKRMCPGEEMAKMLLHLFVGLVLSNFEVSLPPSQENINMDGDCGITLIAPSYKLFFKPIPK